MHEIDVSTKHGGSDPLKARIPRSAFKSLNVTSLNKLAVSDRIGSKHGDLALVTNSCSTGAFGRPWGLKSRVSLMIRFNEIFKDKKIS